MMGYMGLDSINDSDLAADLASRVLNAAAKELGKGLKEKGNTFNTEGCVNVALIFEQCFCSSDDPCIYMNDALRKVANEALSQLRKLEEGTKTWDDEEGNKQMHVRAYRRMIRKLNKFLDKVSA